jgi:hypothetical protein
MSNNIKVSSGIADVFIIHGAKNFLTAFME